MAQIHVDKIKLHERQKHGTKVSHSSRREGSGNEWSRISSHAEMTPLRMATADLPMHRRRHDDDDDS